MPVLWQMQVQQGISLLCWKPWRCGERKRRPQWALLDAKIVAGTTDTNVEDTTYIRKEGQDNCDKNAAARSGAVEQLGMAKHRSDKLYNRNIDNEATKNIKLVDEMGIHLRREIDYNNRLKQ